MSDLIKDVKRGDRFIWLHRSVVKPTVYIEVTRVARDKSWADIRCATWATWWTKRQPLPLPAGTVRKEWTQRDLDRDLEDALDELDAITRIFQ